MQRRHRTPGVLASNSYYQTDLDTASEQTLSLTRTLTTPPVGPGPIPINLYCRNNVNSLGTTVEADAIRLTAVKVGTLDDQDE